MGVCREFEERGGGDNRVGEGTLWGFRAEREGGRKRVGEGTGCRELGERGAWETTEWEKDVCTVWRDQGENNTRNGRCLELNRSVMRMR